MLDFFFCKTMKTKSLTLNTDFGNLGETAEKPALPLSHSRSTALLSMNERMNGGRVQYGCMDG